MVPRKEPTGRMSRMSRDHSGTLTLTHHAVEVVHPVDNMAAKYRNKIGCTANGLSVFKFRVARSLPGDFDIDAVQSLGPVKIKLRFYAPTAPVWGANSTLAVSPDRCEVFPDREYKQVRFTVDFGAARGTATHGGPSATRSRPAHEGASDSRRHSADQIHDLEPVGGNL